MFSNVRLRTVLETHHNPSLPAAPPSQKGRVATGPFLLNFPCYFDTIYSGNKRSTYRAHSTRARLE